MFDPVKIANRVIEYSFYLLFFLIPLVMTPFTSELFEFNKMTLVYLLTALIAAAWLIKMVAAKKFLIHRTFWDFPLLIFLASQFLSFLFSIDRHTSWWGYYSRFHGGLLSTIAFALLYWAFVSNIQIYPNDSRINPKKREGFLFGFIRMPIRDYSDKNTYFTWNCLSLTLFSGLLVSVYGIAEHFGIDAQYWVQDVQNRVFSTLGQPNWLAAYLVAIIPLTWAFALNQKPKTKNQKLLAISNYLYYLLFTIYFLCLLFTKSRSGFLGFGISYLVFWGLIFFFSFSKATKKISIGNLSIKKILIGKYLARKNPVVQKFFWISGLVLAISLAVGTPWTPSIQQLINHQSTKNQPPINDQVSQISESGDIRKIVWKGAIKIWKHHLLLGTGPETFAYSYYWYRPLEHNVLSEWDFLYNKAHNEYLNIAATTGTAGLLAYLSIITTFVLWSLKKISNAKFLISNKTPMSNEKIPKNLGQLDFRLIRNLQNAFLAGFVSILVTNFFGFSVVPISVFFFLFPALAVCLTQKSELKKLTSKDSQPSNFRQRLAIVLIFFSLLAFYFSLFKLWTADYFYAKSKKADQSQKYQEAFDLLQKSIKLRPGEPLYHDSLSLISAQLATSLASQQEKEGTASANKKPEATSSGEPQVEAPLAAELQNLAISESNKALRISPFNLNFWKNRTRVFYTLAEIDEHYLEDALTALIQGSELAPTDAKIFYNLGLLYVRLDQEEKAIETLEKSIELKPNYAEARYALALLYEQNGGKEKAKEQLEYILEKIDPANEAAKNKLEKL